MAENLSTMEIEVGLRNLLHLSPNSKNLAEQPKSFSENVPQDSGGQFGFTREYVRSDLRPAHSKKPELSHHQQQHSSLSDTLHGLRRIIATNGIGDRNKRSLTSAQNVSANNVAPFHNAHKVQPSHIRPVIDLNSPNIIPHRPSSSSSKHVSTTLPKEPASNHKPSSASAKPPLSNNKSKTVVQNAGKSVRKENGTVTMTKTSARLINTNGLQKNCLSKIQSISKAAQLTPASTVTSGKTVKIETKSGVSDVVKINNKQKKKKKKKSLLEVVASTSVTPSQGPSKNLPVAVSLADKAATASDQKLTILKRSPATTQEVPKAVEVNRKQSTDNQKTKETTKNNVSNKEKSPKTDGKKFLPPFPPLHPDILEVLGENFIFLVDKKSEESPNAIFRCHICKYHCNTLEVCSNHIIDKKHSQRVKEKENLWALQRIPCPSISQTKVIEELLLTTVSRYGLSKKELEERENIVSELNKTLEAELPGLCKLECFGSSATGFGLKTCNLNINLSVESSGTEVLPARVLQDVHKIIQRKKASYSNAKIKTAVSMPILHFHQDKSNVSCVIELDSTSSVRTTLLLKLYSELDERVSTICTAFRYWATTCQINDQDRGTFAPHAFDILAVFFLQQCRPPVLPVFHENIVLGKSPASWATQNKFSVGYLWVELLRFYGICFSMSDYVVSVRDSTMIPASKKKWKGNRLCIEDPFHKKRTLTGTLSFGKLYDLVQTCFRSSYRYFGLPRSASEAVLDLSDFMPQRLKPDAGDNNSSEVYIEREEVCLNHSECCKRLSTWKGAERGLVLNGGKDVAEDVSLVRDKVVIDSSVEQSPDKPSPCSVVVRNVQLLSKLLVTFYDVRKDSIHYHFDWKQLTGGKKPIVECNICKREGHFKDECPDVILPPILPLPPMSSSFMAIINRACFEIFTFCQPLEQELRLRENLLRELEVFIRGIYPEACLEMFGSSCNGFGFKNSDLDVCLTFCDSDGKDLNYGDITVNLAEKFKKYKPVYQVLAIPTAKVPIVKFVYRKFHLECDVSLYNLLALKNTRMLNLYSVIDPRVKALGYVMKFFAKVCDIGDASRGSLSSYAYILMVLYFLQQRKPPVIPVLQQLYDKSAPQPVETMNGCNIWYFKDLPNLAKVWPDCGKNTETVGELWLGLLKFYSEEFHFDETVVSIRQLEPLSKFEKLWITDTIAIEDPFDLSHNLGSGLSLKMNAYIRKSFIMGRKVFGTPLHSVPGNYRRIEEYLFSYLQLTDGPLPNDRGCRICGHIGHMVRACPYKKACHICRNTDHSTRDCPNNRKNVQKKIREKYSRPPPPPPPKKDKQTTKVNDSSVAKN